MMTKATTVRMEQHTATLLKELVEKRKSEFSPARSNQAVTADAIKLLHKKEFK
jgi:hypothetical protein